MVSLTPEPRQPRGVVHHRLHLGGDLRGGGKGTWLCIEREFFIDNLLVRIHFIIVMIRWTGLAPWLCITRAPPAPPCG